jgi:hypothetical protein
MSSIKYPLHVLNVIAIFWDSAEIGSPRSRDGDGVHLDPWPMSQADQRSAADQKCEVKR